MTIDEFETEGKAVLEAPLLYTVSARKVQAIRETLSSNNL
jgi:hypothetical protein